MTNRRTNGFTLVEMLTVLVIVAVLIGLAVPAVTNLMSSGGVSGASREVANTIGLARQYAITHRTYARVVFPYSLTTSQPDMWYRTYAVMTNRSNSASATTLWTYLTKWEYLPLGAVFLDVAHATSPSPNGALNDGNSLSQDPIPGGLGGQLAYIEFGPTGVASGVPANSSSTTPSTLAITEGFTTVNGTMTPTASKTNVNMLANLTTINVDTLVGRVQVTR
jgi:prepilin-type N-terminal cleavage/methylation domain-containing protein